MTVDETFTTSEARQRLYDLVEKVAKFGQTITLTHHGKIAAVMINPEEFASWQETLALQSDSEVMKKIKQGEKEISRGQVIKFDSNK